MNKTLIHQIKQIHRDRSAEIVELRERLSLEYLDDTVSRSPEEWIEELGRAEWAVEDLHRAAEGISENRKRQLIVEQGIAAQTELKLAGAEHQIALDEFRKLEAEWVERREKWSSKQGHLQSLVQAGNRAAAEIRGSLGLRRDVTRLQGAS